MIKVKIISGIGDNNDELTMGNMRRSFSAMVYSMDMLKDYQIEIVSDGSNDYDYEFIDKRCWQNRKLGSLEASIEKGVNFLSKRTGDYFLLDGGDCTSLMASIEVLRNTNAKMILKKHAISIKNWLSGFFFGRVPSSLLSRLLHEARITSFLGMMSFLSSRQIIILLNRMMISDPWAPGP